MAWRDIAEKYTNNAQIKVQMAKKMNGHIAIRDHHLQENQQNSFVYPPIDVRIAQFS
jgi:hypothetical protein